MRKRFLPVFNLLGLIFFLIFTTQAIGAQSPIIKNEEESIKKSLSKFSYSLAIQAANWGLPAVIMYNLRYNDALKPGAKSQPNAIWRLENITTPDLAAKAGYVTPNVNVIYGFGFFDLSHHPIILTAPNSNNRYYMIQLVDMYTNSFAYVGGVATGYQGGKFAIVGPYWKGTLPAGIQQIQAPTSWILIQPRVHVINDEDLPNARKVLDDITVQSLPDYLGQPGTEKPTYNFLKPNLTNPNLPVSAVDFKDPLQFWKIMSAVINENPPPKEQIAALLPMFKPLGIELGKTWDPTHVSPIILNSMKQAAAQIGQLNANLPIGKIANGWYLPPPAIGNPGTDYYLRAIVARVGLTANVPNEAIYFMGTVDNNNQILISDNHYSLTFKKQPSFIKPGFWSLTLYDATNNYTVANSIHRYSLGSDNPMKLNVDGSLTIYIQHASPGKNKEANWLPSGNGTFYLILRAYAPGKEMIDSLSNPTIYSPPLIIREK